MIASSIESEIRYFLSAPAPGVLCIKGQWGVGKTHAWRKALASAQKDGKLALSKYSYVSLFGLNSLDDLKLEILLRRQSGASIGKEPDEATVLGNIRGANAKGALASLGQAFSLIMNRKGVADIAAKASFMFVTQQIVCLDDLERASKGLSVREVLGLVSMLSESRGCKVAILLNEEQHDEKDEFKRQLEKVADRTLVFNLSPKESAEIAVSGTTHFDQTLRDRMIDLDMRNLRVNFRLAKAAHRLVECLPQDEELVDSCIATMVLGFYAGSGSEGVPPFNFIRRYDKLGAQLRANTDSLSAEEVSYHELLKTYPYDNCSRLDSLILDSTENGHFQEDAIQSVAREILEERQLQPTARDFDSVWSDLYFGSLETDDDTFLDALYDSACREMPRLSASNIHTTIQFLRKAGRDYQVNDVMQKYFELHAAERPEFYAKAHAEIGVVAEEDKLFRTALLERYEASLASRDPIESIKEIASGRAFTEDDLFLLRRMTEEDFVRTFESLRGPEIRKAASMIGMMSINVGAEGDSVRGRAVMALERIGDKSPLRRQKVQGLMAELS